MLYQFLKIPSQLALLIYCRDIRIRNKEYLRSEGPLLIAANHPNSFLDAIILASLFKRPIYSLARGDAFKSPGYARILRWLNMFPVYRVSEGVENLDHNYTTFDECKSVFKRNGIVLIFSEGRCINEWHLRPLKKGTARLAISSWEEGIPLTVLPLGINYSSFDTFGKNVQLNFGSPIEKKDITLDDTYGRSVVAFNERLKQELQQLVIEKDKNDTDSIKATFAITIPLWKRLLLFFPALAGFILHAPLYFPVKWFTWPRTNKNDHYDSVMVGILFIVYPFYLMAITITAVCVTGSLLWWLLLLILPFCAYATVQLKHQFKRA